VRPKELRQLVTAVADGAIAATNAEKYVEAMRVKLGLPEFAEDEREDATAAPPAAAEAAAGETCPAAAASTASAGAAALDTDAAGAPLGSVPSFFDDALIEQLTPVLEHFEGEVGITAVFDGSTGLDREVRAFLSEFARLTSKVKVSFLRHGADPAREQELGITALPGFALTSADGQPLGVRFHGVPSGHEINSFILALYNAAGPGQSIDEALAARIAALEEPVNLKVGVSLSCTLCPDVVSASQLMALRNPHITAEMIDVAHFPEFKKRWSIMSVPAVVINDERIIFGKKSLEELIDIVKDVKES
jgi:thioredoxin reductase (NADPH)